MAVTIIMMTTLVMVFIIGIAPAIYHILTDTRKKAYRITYGYFANSTAFVTARSPQKAVIKFYRKYGRNWEIRKIEEMDW